MKASAPAFASAPAPLPPAVSGTRFGFDSVAGRLSACVDGVDGGAGHRRTPLLRVHSVNAAASAAEVAPLFEHFKTLAPVLAPDLPGYGCSARSDRPYTPRLMTDAVHAAVQQIQSRFGPGPVDAVGVSLGCEFVARAAAEQPAQFRKLALVSPTGFSGKRAWRGAPGSTRAVPGMLKVLRGPGWGGALFRSLTRPGVVRYFLQRTWGSKAIDEALWRYDVLTARQPGAEFAPLTFLSGGLFSADIRTVYGQLTQPVWVSHGQRGDFTDYRGLVLFAGKSNWHSTVYPTGALPYFELPQRFANDLTAFLAPL